MRVGVVGGREFHNKNKVIDILNGYVKFGDVLVSGGGEGFGEIVKYYALNNGFDYKEYTYEDVDFIVNDSDIIFAFPTYSSKGTWNIINSAVRKGKRFVIIKEV